MIVASAFLGVLMAPASASLAMIVTPLAESATRITTDLTLLELSDLGRPLLRRLAQEAPGTWAHSLAMASLCESACNIIGANGLLARVGCYYHDVGKLANPRLLHGEPGRGTQPARRAEPDRIGADHPQSRAGRHRAGRGRRTARCRESLYPRTPWDHRDHLFSESRSAALPRRAGEPRRLPLSGSAAPVRRDRRGHAGRLGGGGGPRARRPQPRAGARSDRAAGGAEARVGSARRGARSAWWISTGSSANSPA